MTSDLLSKLRRARIGLCTENPADYVARGLTVADALDAADTIDRLTAERDRLREALRKAELWTDEKYDVGEWREEARAALKETIAND